MERMLADISRTHFPNPPATRVEIEAFERRVGWRLDPELRAFYQHSNGAELFRRPNSPCRLRPLSRVQRARLDMRGENSPCPGPAASGGTPVPSLAPQVGGGNVQWRRGE
jgi:hypothetical protein